MAKKMTGRTLQQDLHEFLHKRHWTARYKNILNPWLGLLESTNPEKHPLYKTKRCKDQDNMYFNGGCPKGDSCPFAHTEEELRIVGAEAVLEEFLYELQVIRPSLPPLHFRNAQSRSKSSTAKAEIARMCFEHLGFRVTYTNRLCPGDADEDRPIQPVTEKPIQVLLHELCQEKDWKLTYIREEGPQAADLVSGGLGSELEGFRFSLELSTDTKNCKTFKNPLSKTTKAEAKGELATACSKYLGMRVCWIYKLHAADALLKPENSELEMVRVHGEFSKKQLQTLLFFCNACAEYECVKTAVTAEEWLSCLGSLLKSQHPAVFKSIHSCSKNLKAFLKEYGHMGPPYLQSRVASLPESKPEQSKDSKAFTDSKIMMGKTIDTEHVNYLIGRTSDPQHTCTLVGRPLDCVLDRVTATGAEGADIKELKQLLESCLKPPQSIKTARLLWYLEHFPDHFCVHGDFKTQQRAYLHEMRPGACQVDKGSYVKMAQQSKTHEHQISSQLVDPNDEFARAAGGAAFQIQPAGFSDILPPQMSGKPAVANADAEKDKVVQVLSRFGFDESTSTRIVNEHGISSILILSFLQEQDFVEMGLLLGQKRAMSRAVAAAGEVIAKAQGPKLHEMTSIQGIIQERQLQLGEQRPGISESPLAGSLGPGLGHAVSDEAVDICLDPITEEVMTDPVMAADGHTYQRAGIEKWLRDKGPVSMVTGAPLPNTTLTPNKSVRDQIAMRHPGVKLAPWVP